MEWLHNAITFFVLAGGLLWDNIYYLKAHFFFCGCIILQWLINDNRCILSEKDHEDKNGYTKQLLGYLGITVAEDDRVIGNSVAYGSALLSMAISYWRFSGPKTANVITVTDVPTATVAPTS